MLFDPIALRGVSVRNRAWVSPMCMYSAREGVPGPWHLVHLGARAAGGAGLVMAEATAVEPEGRITPGCAGIWSDEQAAAWAPITAFIRENGAVPAIQLAHAGRKASTRVPWDPVRGGLPDDQGGWKPRGPAAEPFSPALKMPDALTIADIEELRTRWVQAARRAVEAGFQAVELHSAHGYLFHQFLSPLSNPRTDGYGGGFEGRTRFLRETAAAVRDAIPDSMPLLVRLSTTDWIEGGWDVEQSVELARLLKAIGVDLMDCSSGGARLDAKIPVGPGFQVPMAEAIRRQAGIPTAAVGMITTPEQAESILAEGRADALMIGRGWLDDPHWAIHAAKTLGAPPPFPKQYAWVFAPKG